MQTVIDLINQYLSVFDMPGTEILAATAAVALALVFSRLFSRVVLKYVQRLTQKTRTTIDDQVIDVLKVPLSWVIILGGVWVAHAILAAYMSEQFDEVIRNVLGLGFVIVVAMIVYRSAKTVASIFARFSKRTRAEIDDLILPYISSFIQAMALLLVAIKASEVLLGVSATALLGLLGGAGITLGLVFKDVLSDWLSTIIIYGDDLYRVGDMIQLPDGSFALVERIGLRSTVARTFAGPVVKIPNSQMVQAKTPNWSQATKWKAEYKLALDGISSAQTDAALQGIRGVIASQKDVDQSWSMVYLTRIEGNSRVINLEYSATSDGFVNDDELDANGYYDHFVLTVEKVNLAILALLEEQQIDPLAYTLFGSVGAPRRWTAKEHSESDEGTIGTVLAGEQWRASGE
jgi:MscS family membrane protein